MRDVALDCLLSTFMSEPAVQGKVLWVADEQAREMVRGFAGVPDLEVITNRYDVAQAARMAEVVVHYNDFDFSALADGSVARVFYRVSKEKAVVHHVLNEVQRVLAPDGELLFTGYKNEGTKTFYEKARALLGKGQWQKEGVAYLARCTRSVVPTSTPLLDSQQYPELRLMEAEDAAYYSKPGVFGWNKIDVGSAFLVEHLPVLLARLPAPPASLLDLGCGYGYLIAATAVWPLTRRVATDNNAAAIRATRATVEHLGLEVDVIADDFGSSLKERFDVILCNPPFHQGFRVDDRLTTNCLQQTARLLAPTGAALFVVNAFVPLETAAQPFFRRIELLAHCGSFKLVLLEQAKAVR
jgi:16S rRNA (guanine1207-N2)-methyltransferase